MVKKNLKVWEECLPYVEFAYNRAVHSTTNMCPFEIVYGFKPITSIDLLPLPLQERTNMEVSKHAAYIKKVHEKTKEAIELKAGHKAASMNKHRKKMLFEPRDLVWIHLHKDRFPQQRKSKLLPRGDGSFRVLEKINDNTYKIDLPASYGVSNSFNGADLSPFTSEDTSESRTTPFQGREDDMTMPPSKISQAPSQATPTQVSPTPTPVQVIDGPITHSRAKKLQHEVHVLLCEIYFNINEIYILPKCCTLIVLRYIEEEKDESNPEDGLANRTTRVKNRPVQDLEDKLAKRTSRI